MVPVQGVAGAAQGPVVQQEQENGQRDDRGFGHQADEKRGEHGTATDAGRAPDMVQIGEKGQHEEQAAQDVLALGDPGHGLDPQGMKREKRGDKPAAPPGAGHAGQHPEQQGCVCGVEENVGSMESGRCRALEFGVEHVGNPENRQPPLFVNGSECPADVGGRQARDDMFVVRDEQRVVEPDETIADGWPEDRQNQKDENRGHAAAHLEIRRPVFDAHHAKHYNGRSGTRKSERCGSRHPESGNPPSQDLGIGKGGLAPRRFQR